MKILFLLSRIDRTGVTTHTLDLAGGLIKEGHQVFLIAGNKVHQGKSHEEFYNKFLDMGVVIKEFNTPSGNAGRKLFGTIASIIKMIRIIKGLRPNIIHCQSPYLSFVPWLIGKKFTVTIHNTKLKKDIKFKNPTHLIAISNESREMAQHVFGINGKTISIVHHGVSDRYALPLSIGEQQTYRAQSKIPSEKVIVGFVGRTTWKKGCDVLVEAMAKLDDATKDKMHGIFLGGIHGSDEFNWLQKLIDDSGHRSLCHHASVSRSKTFL